MEENTNGGWGGHGPPRRTTLTWGPLQHFLLAIEHGEAIPDPSPAPHLYLAQLSSPEESLSHFASALTILQAKLAVIEHAKLGADGGAGTELEAEDEGELRRSASRALVGMTELYLTDLWSVAGLFLGTRELTVR